MSDIQRRPQPFEKTHGPNGLISITYKPATLDPNHSKLTLAISFHSLILSTFIPQVAILCSSIHPFIHPSIYSSFNPNLHTLPQPIHQLPSTAPSTSSPTTPFPTRYTLHVIIHQPWSSHPVQHHHLTSTQPTFSFPEKENPFHRYQYICLQLSLPAPPSSTNPLWLSLPPPS